MIKNTLENFEEPIQDLLPLGSINKLAELHGYARQTVSEMLRGKRGDEENVREVLNSVITILKENSRAQLQLADKIGEILKTQPAEAA